MPLAIGRGALAGIALGFLLVAPVVVETHRLAPPSAAGWIALLLGLGVAFAVLGGFAGIYAVAPAVALAAAGRRRQTPAEATDSIVVVLPVVYLAFGLLVEKATFGSIAPPGRVVELFAVWATIAVAAIALASRSSRRTGRRPQRALALGAAIGAALLPVHAPALAEPVAVPPLSSPAPGAPPLLFVAVDGASWAALAPLLERGELANLGALARDGIQGDVWNEHPPHWSAVAWGSIATGVPPAAVGVREDVAASVPVVGSFEIPLALDPLLDPILALELGLHRLGVLRLHYHPRDSLRAPPFWERASRAGVPTAIIGLPFTHPAEGVADVVVSNWLGTDLWEFTGFERDDGSDGIHPRRHADALGEAYADDSPAGLEGWLRELVPSPPAPEAEPRSPFDPMRALELAVGIDWRTWLTAERALALAPETRLLAVYLHGLDGISHAFWRHAFPHAYPDDPPAPEEVRRFGGVIAGYWRFLDRAIGSLANALAEPPNVLLVADHGFEPIGGHPLWHAWHSARGGVFLAAGPSIAPRRGRAPVHLVDVAPTALALLGFDAVPDLPGRPLVEPDLRPRPDGSRTGETTRRRAPAVAPPPVRLR